MSDLDFRKCPHCGEDIKAAALKCRYCTNWVVEEAVNASMAEQGSDYFDQPSEIDLVSEAGERPVHPAWPSTVLTILAGLLIALGLAGIVIGAGFVEAIGIIFFFSSAVSLLSGIGFLVLVKLLR